MLFIRVFAYVQWGNSLILADQPLLGAIFPDFQPFDFKAPRSLPRTGLRFDGCSFYFSTKILRVD